MRNFLKNSQIWFESSCFLYAGQSVMMIVKTETIPPYDPWGRRYLEAVLN